jgi:serine/threonine protein kinase
MRLGPESKSRLGRLLADRMAGRYGFLAVRNRYVTEEQLRIAMAERASTGRRLDEILARRGWLDPKHRTTLDAELAAEDPWDRCWKSIPPEVRSLAQDPDRRFAEYVLVSMIGSGGAAEVWKAWDVRMARWVAIKRPTCARAHRMFQEAAAAARLDHPCIVKIHGIHEEKGRPYLVMQLVEGQPLSEARLAIPQAVRAVRTIARAVQYAHERGVVHRDLKPENVLMNREGRLWVLDFGLAFMEGADHSLTIQGSVIGTPWYMSPEQARGDVSARKPATDIYGLGAMLYSLLTHRPPFDGNSLQEVLRKVAGGNPTPPRRLNPAVSPELEAVVLKAMAKNPADRHSTAGEFAAALDRLGTRRAGAASLWSRLSSGRLKKPWLIRAAVAAAVLLIAALAIPSLKSGNRPAHFEKVAQVPAKSKAQDAPPETPQPAPPSRAPEDPAPPTPAQAQEGPVSPPKSRPHAPAPHIPAPLPPAPRVNPDECRARARAAIEKAIDLTLDMGWTFGDPTKTAIDGYRKEAAAEFARAGSDIDLAWQAFAEQRYKDCIDSTGKILEREPENAQAHRLRGHAHLFGLAVPFPALGRVENEVDPDPPPPPPAPQNPDGSG